MYVCPTEFNRISRRNIFSPYLFILMLLSVVVFFLYGMDSHLLSDSCLHTLHAITDLVDSFLMFLFSFPFLYHSCRRCRWLFFLFLLFSISFIHYSKFGDACSHLSVFNFVYCIFLFLRPFFRSLFYAVDGKAEIKKRIQTIFD